MVRAEGVAVVCAALVLLSIAPCCAWRFSRRAALLVLLLQGGGAWWWIRRRMVDWILLRVGWTRAPHLVSTASEVFGVTGLGARYCLRAIAPGRCRACYSDCDCPRLLVVYLHGTASTIASAPAVFRRMLVGAPPALRDSCRVVCLAPEYPGYCDRSHGIIEPTVFDTVESVVNTIEHVSGKFPGHDLVLVGESLGAAVALSICARLSLGYSIARVVLVSPLTSARSLAADFVGSFLARCVPAHVLNGLDEIPHIRASTGTRFHVVCGSHDRLIHPRHSRAIRDELGRCGFKVDAQIVRNGTHATTCPDALGHVICEDMECTC